MMDKRKRESGNADLWDYRHAKLLLDMLATGEDFELVGKLRYLCEIWGIKAINYLDEPDVLDMESTLKALAQHCLSHGRQAVKERQSDETNSDVPTLYDVIALNRTNIGLKPECDYCNNTGFRTDYIGKKKECTKCYVITWRDEP